MDEEYEEVCELLHLCFTRFKGVMKDQIQKEMQRLQQGQIQFRVESSGYKIQNARDSGWHGLGMYDPSIPEAIQFWFLEEDEEEALEKQEEVIAIESGYEEQESFVAAFEELEAHEKELESPLSSLDHSDLFSCSTSPLPSFSFADFDLPPCFDEAEFDVPSFVEPIFDSEDVQCSEVEATLVDAAEETYVPCKGEVATNCHSLLSIQDMQVDNSMTDHLLKLKIGMQILKTEFQKLTKFRGVPTYGDKVMTSQVFVVNAVNPRFWHLAEFEKMDEKRMLAGQPEEGNDGRSFIFDRGKFRIQHMQKVWSCLMLNQVFKVLWRQQDSQGCRESPSASMFVKIGMELSEITIQDPAKFQSISLQDAGDITLSIFDIKFGEATVTVKENSQQLLLMHPLELKFGRAEANTGIQPPTKFQGVSVEDGKVILLSKSVKLSALSKKEQVLDMLLLARPGTSEPCIQAMEGYFGRVRPPEPALEPDHSHFLGMFFHFVRPPDFCYCSIILGHLQQFFHFVRPPDSRF